MRWFLRLRICIIICLAVMLVSAAVLFSALRATLPHATGYKNEIQQEISKQLGLPVEIASIDAAIHWFSPRLRLLDVAVFDDKDKTPLFNFREAFVELDIVASILRQEIIVNEIGLVGASISIDKLSDSEWLIQGIKFTSEGSSELPDQFLYMILNADYLLHDSDIYYRDHTGDKLNLSLRDVNIDVNNSFSNHKIKFSMNLPEDFGKDLAVVASLNGELENLAGDIYVEINQLKVKQWNKKFKLLETYQLDAVLDVNLWTVIEKNNIQSLLAQVSASNVSVRNNTTAKSWRTEHLSSNIRYKQKKGHWEIAVSEFYFGKELAPEWPYKITALASDDEDNYYLSADFLRLGDLQDIAEVFLSEESFADLNTIKSYQLQADIYNLNLKLPKDLSKQPLLDELLLDVSIVDFSMFDKENDIRLSGVDVLLHYDVNDIFIDMATEDAQLEIRKLFRAPLFANTISGKLTLEHDEDNWRLSSSQLQLKNSHINTFSRLDIRLPSEGKVFVDVQTDFTDGYGKYARHYVPVGVMSPRLVRWLDMAVTDGYVPEGSFLLHGNLDEYPFNEHNGVFQILFSPQNVSMQFLENWPLLTDASATVKFNNTSLVVKDARGRTQQTSLFNGYAEILNLPDPHLTVTTNARGKNTDIQSYIWNSELDDILGNAMRLFQFKGESRLKLKLDVPLNRKKIDVVIDGHLNFNNAEIYYPELGYEISEMNGVVDFTRDSIFADSIEAKIQNKPVHLNALTKQGESGPEVVFHLDGVLAADYLLQRYDWIPREWIAGQSVWSMDFEIPYTPKDYLVHVKASSHLQDVAIKLSDKVHKAANREVNFVTEIDVLDDNGLHVEAQARDASGLKIFDLYAVRYEDYLWDFTISSEYMTGKGEFTEGLGRDTQVKLDLEKIDLHALFVSKNGTKSEPLKPTDFPPLDWKVKKLLWDDWVLTDVKLGTSWNKHGMLINKFSLKGPAMTFDARGTWLTSWSGSQETVLQAGVTSSNFGETLAGLGFQRSIDRSKYTAKFDAKWPAEPYALSWANMEGTTSFEMNDGEILEVEPGVEGRLLGLMNIFRLTSRLSLDFDDVIRKGFSFDKINGDFKFVNGDGSLKKFEVSAAAADINMFGRIGLVKRDYDLLMRVKPHTDTLTFAGAALLGGVAVGAGVALIQKVFDLGVIGHNVYQVTGSWDDPEIEKIIEKTIETEEDDF